MKTNPTPRLQRASDIVDQETRWLWKPWLPAGTLSRIDGDPGLGKSTLTLDLVSRVSTGEPMPGHNRARSGQPRNVLVLAAEDITPTIKRRLEAAGADLDRVHVYTDDEVFFPTSLKWLEAEVSALEAALIVIDPLMAFLDVKLSSNQDQDVRQALRPMGGVAERTGAAILLVGHLNKKQGSHSMYRVGGSVALMAAVRLAMLVAADPSDPDLRVLTVQKSNLGLRPRSWEFEVIDNGDGEPVIEWIARRDLTADDLLNTQERPAQDQGTRAVEMLVELLETEDCTVSEIEAEAKRRGIGKSTLRVAKDELGVRQYYGKAKPGKKGHGPSHWSLDVEEAS